MKASINKLKEADAWNACYDLGMDLPKTANAKSELLKEAKEAYQNNNASRLKEIERAIKKNSR